MERNNKLGNMSYEEWKEQKTKRGKKNDKR